ncbi:MAG: TraB/GumN family protein [Halobacteriales archaeon]|nr:TraB/GumN family protein [Halobacteriales archaeon]
MGDVTIVGTAHVSEKSALDVRETIRDEQPDYVAVELDPRRYETVKDRDGSYGGDMAAAVEEAEERGIPVVLIDRDINVTLKRFWGELSFFERVKTVGALVVGFLGFGGVEVEEIDRAIEENRVEGYVEELREFSPSGARVLIDERDAYMADRLSELDGKVVAVVGAGHEEGIRKYLENPDDIPDVPCDREVADTDVYESEDAFLVVVDLPGFEKQDVSVSTTGSRLDVDAEGRNRFAVEGYRFVGERRPDAVEASLNLSVPVDADDADASYDDGVLRVRLPKA